MFVGGFSFAGTLARPASNGHADAAGGPEARDGDGPVYLRSISAISPGSLAAAYQALRTHESAVAPAMPAGEPAILSGLGIPGALEAYGEVMGGA